MIVASIAAALAAGDAFDGIVVEFPYGAWVSTPFLDCDGDASMLFTKRLDVGRIVLVEHEDDDSFSVVELDKSLPPGRQVRFSRFYDGGAETRAIEEICARYGQDFRTTLAAGNA